MNLSESLILSKWLEHFRWLSNKVMAMILCLRTPQELGD